MSSPRVGTRTQMREARRDLLCEIARQFAWGAATADELCEAADAYGELCEQPAGPAKAFPRDDNGQEKTG